MYVHMVFNHWRCCGRSFMSFAFDGVLGREVSITISEQDIGLHVKWCK